MKVTSVAEQMLFTTVRVETISKDGRPGVGTAFLFSKEVEGGTASFVVTNRHVVAEAIEVIFTFTRSEGANPVLGSTYRIRILDVESQFTFHSNPDIDVAITPFVPILNQAESKGIELFTRAIDPDLMLEQAELQDLDALEDVVFIGYPNGIWDSANNLPIIRRGVTASPIGINFEGRPQFLVDAAVFPGSSGSPVFLYNVGSFGRKGAGAVLGSRLHFLGVLSAVFYREDTGRIEMLDAPTTLTPVPVSRQMINLGIVFKATAVLETVEQFLSVAAQN